MNRRRSPAQTGFSLIELMVSLAIGLIVTLAITGVLVRSESSKRSSTSLNDVNQTGAYITYVMDRAVRSAGSGFAQRWAESFGCSINASRSGAPLLPSAAAFPAPFASMPITTRLAPIVITKGTVGTGSDILTVMAGNAGFGEAPIRVLTGSVTASNIGLPNTLAFRPNDLVMVIDSAVGCMVQQVASSYTPATVPNTAPANQALPLGGVYANATGTNFNLVQFGVGGVAYAVALGNAANTSQFQMYGVGDNRTLFSYDMLQLQSTTPIPIADNVVAIRALYGIDSNLDGILDSWVDPVAPSPYAAATLMNGTAASQQLLRTIVSVKVGFILRGAESERDPGATTYKTLSPPSITLFSDLGAGLAQTQTINAADQIYRYRAVEVTVPLRNVLLL